MNGEKLLVFSDSHGGVTAVKAVFAWALNHMPPKDTLRGAAFCGDGLADLQPAADASGFYCDWKLVGGNNDYGYAMPDSTVFEFGGFRFFMCHGHKHNIYTGFRTLIAAARANEAHAVLFGHAHIPIKKTEDGILLLNPGSVDRPRNTKGASFAVIECAEGKPLEAEFFGISARGTIKGIKI